MAGFSAIYSVGDSLVSYLRHAYELSHEPEGLPTCRFELVPSGKMAGSETNTPPVEVPGVTLFLYRVAVNEHLRNEPRAEAPPPLALDLHYLLTVWAENVDDEHRIMAWVMLQLHTHNALSASDLSPVGVWRPDELVQIIPAEIPQEDILRMWDALRRPYRPSVTYVARVVCIDVQGKPAGRPVVARRFDFTNEVPRS
ncbi:MULTISPECIES: DUF4255 domain-containing protein [Myxococcus]|uniref:DUF4255 domain-containing protein n=1 Tax=Myxococcus TaxID=32 RepID=UPI00112CD168|nr:MULTISPECIES: DUF4255 domain-containing protein [Myxococcus]WAM23485.1 DUF4255 domain-containing protein [Myxococcus sp. NMCA1]